MAKTIVVASGKGGTGKTMFVANLGAMLSELGKKVVLIDMDAGLRNLDLYLGLENNVVYDVYDVLTGVCRIKQAIIKDKEFDSLDFIAASPKPDDGEITPLHMKVLCNKLKKKYDYIIVDAPAGFDDNLQVAIGGADDVFIVTVPEYSSLRNAENMASNLNEQGIGSVYYVLNKVNLKLIKKGLAPELEEIPGIIKDRIVGIIQDDEDIHIATNLGSPIVLNKESYIRHNFEKIAGRILEL
ncbi:MAG: septum site-determining protein MinD [Clostridia bacterium]|nr:septum site-determining protein MinD [Clostridia bacterium]